jgi:hypothetical protein
MDDEFEDSEFEENPFEESKFQETIRIESQDLRILKVLTTDIKKAATVLFMIHLCFRTNKRNKLMQL